MSTAVMTDHTPEMSPRRKARIAGAFYVLTFVAGFFAMGLRPENGVAYYAANYIGAGVYVVVTLLFYDLFKPVSRTLSLIAALFSLAGCTVGTLNLLHLPSLRVNSLVFFGVYCLLIGYLIWRSAFIPRVVGALMMFGGLGWLTFASPALAKSLSPFIYFPGLLGEGVLTVWLLTAGVKRSAP